MTDWESEEFFRWMEEHDKKRFIIEETRGMSKTERDAFLLQCAFAPRLTLHGS